MWSPIIVFAYNRLEHLQRCLKSLEDAEGAEMSDIYIFADGYKGKNDSEKVLAVQRYLREYQGNARFGQVHIICEEKNKGLASSVIEGVSKIIEEHGRVIVVEDDLVVSPDFLIYMNSALQHYEKDSRVWQISGWSPQLPVLDGLQEDTFLWYRGNSWGWATWLDRWDIVDWDVKDYAKFKFSLTKRYKMNRGGADMSDMLDMQMKGLIDSWAIRFAYTESMENKLSVFSKNSRVIDCGTDGSGTHYHASIDSIDEGELLARVMSNKKSAGQFKWGEQLPNRKICRQLYRIYSGNIFYWLRKKIGSVLKRLNLKRY